MLPRECSIHEAESHGSLCHSCFGTSLHCLLHVLDEFLQRQEWAVGSVAVILCTLCNSYCCRGAELKATHLTAQLFIQIEIGFNLAQVCFLS